MKYQVIDIRVAQYWRILINLIMFVISIYSPLVLGANLNEIRTWNSPERTRIVLDLDQKPVIKTLELKNPSRYVIDLKGFNLNPSALKNTRIGSYIKGIRTGVPARNTARVVLDLNQKVRIKTLVLAPVQNYQYRLVIDIYPYQSSATGNIISSSPSIQPTSTRPSAKSQKNQPFIIAIDAGHGGEDSGARGKRSHEKKIVLQIAKRLQQKINAQRGMKAILTRKSDYYVTLRQRTELARKAGANLFISIHADGFKNPRARGSSVYALSLRGASSETARWLANKENTADLVGGANIASKDDSVAEVILNLSMDTTLHESITFASSVLKQLKRIGKVHNSSVEKAGFVVLKSPDIPSILVETAFITNPNEERLLRSAKHQDKLASAILKGTQQYLANSSYHTAQYN